MEKDLQSQTFLKERAKLSFFVWLRNVGIKTLMAALLFGRSFRNSRILW